MARLIKHVADRTLPKLWPLAHQKSVECPVGSSVELIFSCCEDEVHDRSLSRQDREYSCEMVTELGHEVGEEGCSCLIGDFAVIFEDLR